MSHRVHTILSILAEDHAPAALRPSIILAIDWPIVAEEAPATEQDSRTACAAGILAAGGSFSGLIETGASATQVSAARANIASLAARLATVAASLAATGDKAMATHATALWGAAAALVVMPQPASMLEVRNTLAEEVKGHEHLTVILVARDLGSDPEAWRRAMREWTANGNKHAAPTIASLAAAYRYASARWMRPG